MLEDRALLAAIMVTTFTDVVDGGDGLISLREAITTANASGEADTITLPAGTYTVAIAGTGENANATGDYDILSDSSNALTIQGAGAGVTIIDGADLDRLFDVQASATLNLNGLTVQNGTSNAANGGGINTLGTLNLTDSVVTANVVSGANGGGIYSSGDMSITRSTISSNQAIKTGSFDGDGGAFWHQSGTLTIVASTINGNDAGRSGGGFRTGVNSVATVHNTTISANVDTFNAGGFQVFSNNGTSSISVVNSTITGNSGGINNAETDTINIANTIIAGNTGSDVTNGIDSGVNSIIGTSASAGGLTHGTNGNIVGNSGSGTLDINTVLNATLSSYGGPTQTHALVTGSPALDAGSNSEASGADLTVDQRGAPRVINGAVDIGAVERFLDNLGLVEAETQDLTNAIATVVNADGSFAYTAAGGNIVVFSRSTPFGELSHVQTLAGGAGALVSVDLSPDGMNLYAVTNDGTTGGLVVFDVNTATGQVSLSQTLVENVNSVDGILTARSVKASLDGKNVYVIGATEKALVVFTRSASDGTLTFLEVHKEGVNGADGLQNAQGLALSPDNGFVYSAGDGDGGEIGVFSRNLTTGALTYQSRGDTSGSLGMLDVVISPDGAHAYGATNAGRINTYTRNTGTGALTRINELNPTELGNNFRSIAISPAGEYVYVVEFSNKVGVLKRDTSTGLLTIVEALSDGGTDSYGTATSTLATGTGNGTDQVTVSPDGATIYVSARGDNAINVFSHAGPFLDFGDAPAPYRTTLGENGARHVASGLTLGATRDAETDATRDATATGDDLTGSDDEDGVTFGTITVGQQNTTVTVNVQGAAGKLDAWIDFNGDGSFFGPGEQIAAGLSVLDDGDGNNDIVFDVPADAVDGSVVARFRLSTAGGLAPSGLASDGEVEDHILTLTAPAGSGTFTDTGQALSSAGGEQRNTGTYLADFDSDGDLDALFIRQDEDAAIFFNDGTGTFGSENLITTGTALRDGEIGDFNGDGHIDFVHGGSGTVYLNTGSGTFNAATGTQTRGSSFGGFAVGDVNGDGTQDIVVANSSTTIHSNSGTASFSQIQSISTSGANGAALGDLDGDGDLDLFVSAATSVVYQNDGAGNFTEITQSPVLTSTSSSSVALADLDGDGDLDAYVSADNQADRIFKNDGSGNFTEHATGDTGRGLKVRIGDIDGDGDFDAVVFRYASTSVVLVNDGSANFSSSTINTGGSAQGQGDLGDINGDGTLDAVAGIRLQANRVFTNAPPPTTSVAVDGSSNLVVTDIQGGDTDDQLTLTVSGANLIISDAGANVTIDAVGTLDGVTGDGTNSVTIPLSAFTGDVQIRTLGGNDTVNIEGLNLGGARGLDIDAGDGTDNVNFQTSGTTLTNANLTVTAETINLNAGTLSTGTGSQTFNGAVTLGANTTLTSGDATFNNTLDAGLVVSGNPGVFVANGQSLTGGGNDVNLADLDGDGDLDAITSDGESYRNDGAGNFTLITDLGFGGSLNEIDLGDIDGDGDLDALLSRFRADTVILQNDGTGAFSILQTLENGDRIGAVLADIDGDSDLDAIVGNEDGGARLYKNNGSGTFAFFVQTPNTNGGNHRELRAGDLDGDGDQDLFVARNGQGGVRPVNVLTNDGSGNYTITQSLSNFAAFGADIGDLDGDGDLDAVLNAESDVRVLVNDGSGTFSDSGQSFSTSSGNANSSYNVDLADLDLDGDLDAVVMRPNGRLVLLNNGSGTFTDSGQTVGGTTGIALGDVDGDGDPDAFVTATSAVFINQGTPTRATLTLNASGNVFINGAVGGTGAPSLLKVDSTGSSVAINATVNVGTLDIDPPGSITITAAVTGTSSVNLEANNGITLSGANADVTTSGGTVTIDADADNNGTGTFRSDNAGSAIATSGGAVTVTAADVALTGTINAGAGTVTFDTGQSGQQIALGDNSVEFDLLVSAFTPGHVRQYNSSTGAFIATFTSSAPGRIDDITFGPDGALYVSDSDNSTVLRYADPSSPATFTTFASGNGLSTARGPIFGPDGNLYVGSLGNDIVKRFNGTTGAFIDDFASGNGLDGPGDMVFGPDGNLYVASSQTDEVFRFNGSTGAFIDKFVSAGSGGLDIPNGIDFGPDGNLYVGSDATDQVLRYNGTTGAFIDVFVTAASGGLDRPSSVRFGPDNNLYVAGLNSDRAYKYNGTTGAFIFVVPAGNLDKPAGIEFFSTGYTLSDAELDRVTTTGRIIVGSGTAGDITFTEAINLAGADTLEIITGGNVNDTGTSTVFTDTNLAITAGTGVGTTSALNIAVTNFEASGGTGGVNLSNTGDLTIGGVGTLTGVSATNSNITIATASNITVSEAITAGTGSVTLTSGRTSTGKLTFVETNAVGLAPVDTNDNARSSTISPDGKHLYAAAANEDSVTVYSRNEITGSLTLIQTLTDGVGGVDGLDGAFNIVISPTGEHAYVAGQVEDKLALFNRNTTTGQLTFVEAIQDGVGGVDGLNSPVLLVMSPDGKHIYVSARDDNGVGVFSRNTTTGSLTFVEAEKDGVNGVDGLASTLGLAIAPDGNHVYVGGRNDDALAVFSRNSTTGALTFVEVVKDGVNGVDGLNGVHRLTVSPDNTNVYVTSFDGSEMAVFSRNTTTGALTFLEKFNDGVGGINELSFAGGVTVSPDGSHVYVTAVTDDAVTVFSRNTTTGALTLVETQKDGVNGVDGLNGAVDPTISPDGKFLYVASRDDDLISVFSRDGGTAGAGELTVSANATIGGTNDTGAITLNVDSIEINALGNIDSSGALTIKPRTANTSIGLGGGAGTLNIDDTEITRLADGFSSITIGDVPNGTGLVTVSTSAFLDDVTIAGGDVTVSGAVTNNTDEDMTFISSNTATISANVTAAGSGDVNVNASRNVLVDSNATITTDTGDVSISSAQVRDNTFVDFTGFPAATTGSTTFGTNTVSFTSNKTFGSTDLQPQTKTSNTAAFRSAFPGSGTGDFDFPALVFAGTTNSTLTFDSALPTGARLLVLDVDDTPNGEAITISVNGSAPSAFLSQIETTSGTSTFPNYNPSTGTLTATDTSPFNTDEGTSFDLTGARTVSLSRVGSNGSTRVAVFIPAPVAGNYVGVDLNNGDVTTTSGNIAIRGVSGDTSTNNKGVRLTTGSVVSSTSSAASPGTITLVGNSRSTGTQSSAIEIASSAAVNSVNGNITLTGTSSAAATFSRGVYLHSSGKVQSTGNGVNAATITLTGTSGTSGQWGNGVELGGTTLVTSVDGNISLTGNASTTTVNDNNHGAIFHSGAVLSSTGTATISVHGTGGASSNTNSGVTIQTDATKITSESGDISITGIATASGGNNHGVRFHDGGDVTSTGTADITITATGLGTDDISNTNAGTIIGSGGAGGDTMTGNLTLNVNSITFTDGSIAGTGALLIDPRTVSTTIGIGGGGGVLNIDGTELTKIADGFSSITIGDAAAGTGAVDVNSSTFNDPITIVGGSVAVTEMTAGSNAVTLTALTGNITDGGGATDVTGGAVSLLAPNGDIGQPVATPPGAVEVVATSLVTETANGDAFIGTAGTLPVQNLDGGNGAVTLAGAGQFNLASNAIVDTTSVVVPDGIFDANGATDTFAGLTIQDGARLQGTGTINAPVLIEDGGTLATGNSPGILNTGNLNVSGSFVVDIAGEQAAGDADGFDQTNVTGTVTLGATAALSFDFTGLDANELTVGQKFLIVTNDDADAVAGIFNGFAEGAVAATNVANSGLNLSISYAGGTGNDIELTVELPIETSVAIVSGDLVVTDINGGTTADNLTFTVAGANLTITENAGNRIDLLGVLDGGTGDGTASVTIPLSSFTGEMSVLSLGGNDTLTFLSTFDIGTTRGLNVDAGAGTDTFNWEATAAIGPAQVVADRLFGATLGGDFVELNPSNAAVLSTASPGRLDALAYDPTTGTMYAAKFDGTVDSIDPATGNRTAIGSPGRRVDAMEFNTANNTLYGANFFGDFFTINTSTGATTLIGSLGQTTFGLAIDPVSGTFWGSTTGEFYTIDPATGVRTVITNSFVQSVSLSYDVESQTLYAGDTSGALYTVNPATGATTLVGDNVTSLFALTLLTNPEASLTVTAEGINLNSGAVNTGAGNQTFNGAVVLGANTTLTAAEVTFNGTVDSPDGFVLGTNTTPVVEKFNLDGSGRTGFISGIAQGVGTGVTIDAAGDVYTGENGDDIRKFTANGTDLGVIATHDAPGGRVVGLVVDNNGNIFTAIALGSGSQDIQGFDSAGNELFNSVDLEAGQNGNDVAIAANGNVLLAVSNGKVLEVNPLTGALIGTFVSGLTGTEGVDVDAAGNVYVLNSSGGRNIKKYNSSGTLLATITGDIPAQLAGARNLAVTSDGSRFYVADPSAQDIESFDSAGNHLATLDLSTNTFIHGVEVQDGDYELTINASGNVDFNGIVGGAGSIGSLKIDSTGSTVTVDAAITVAGNLDIDPPGSITINAALTSTGGNVNLEANNGITLSGAAADITTNGGTVTIDADADNNNSGTFTSDNASSAIVSGAGNVTVVAADVALTGTIAGTGTLTLQPSTAARTIGIGGGTGDFNVDDSELGRLTNGFSAITIGDATGGTGTVDVDSSTFSDPVKIVGGSIAVTGLAAASNAITLTARSGAITDGGTNLTDITGGSLAATSTAGVGTTNDAIETTLSSLEAVGGSGVVHVSNNVGLTIGGVSGSLTGVSATNANITISAASDLNVTEAIGSGTGTVTLSATEDAVITANVASTGGGAIIIDAARATLIDAGAIVSTVNGEITLSGNASGTATGTFDGVEVKGSTVRTSGDGNIVITGIGGNTSNSNSGVRIGNGGVVESTAASATAGTITINGTGRGVNSGSGLQVNGSGSVIRSVDGDIQLNVASTASGTNATGFRFDGTSTGIQSTGSGANAANITIIATASASGAGSGTEFVTGEITAVAGDITITATGNSNDDFVIDGASTELGGDTATGNIRINADSIRLDNGQIDSDGSLVIQPRTVSTSIGLGGGAGTLNLTDAELLILQDGFNSITIGSDARATAEDFSSNTLPGTLETVGQAATFSGGAAVFSGIDNGTRGYLRTVRDDHNTESFVAEVTVANSGGRTWLGLGAADLGSFGQPNSGSHLYLEYNMFSGSPAGVLLDNGASSQSTSLAGIGTHRLRLTWDATAQTATFAVHENYTGGPFVASHTFAPLDGSDNAFNGTNGRIFFGGDGDFGGSAGNPTTYDDFTITIPSTNVVTVSSSTFQDDISIGGGTINVTDAISNQIDESVSLSGETISLTTAASDIAVSGTGSITLTASQNILLTSGSSLAAVNGGVDLTANVAGTVAGDFDGVVTVHGPSRSLGAGCWWRLASTAAQSHW